MIELAPQNKRGLSLSSPLIAGSGAAGFGDAWPPGVTARLFGAVVTAPVSWGPQRGPAQPRLAEILGGFLLDTGEQNPGFRRLLATVGQEWPRLGVPLILALAPADPGDWARLAGAAEDLPGIAGLELHLSEDAGSGEVRSAVAGARHETTLPLLVKLPNGRAAAWAEACATAGADALVVGTPPMAAWPVGEGAWVEAPVGGPAAFPFTLMALRRVTGLGLALPLVAAGGIQTTEEAARCLELGAIAIQARSLLWTDPAAVLRLAGGLRNLGRLDE